MEHQDSFTEGGIQFFLAKSEHLWEWEGALFIIKLYLSNQDRHPTFTLFFALLTTSLFYQLCQLFLSQPILFKKLLVIEWLKDHDIYLFTSPPWPKKPAWHSQFEQWIGYTVMFETIIRQPLYWFPVCSWFNPVSIHFSLIYNPTPAQWTQHLHVGSQFWNSQCPCRRWPPNFPLAVSTILYPRKAALHYSPPTRHWEPVPDSGLWLDCPLAYQNPGVGFRYNSVTDTANPQHEELPKWEKHMLVGFLGRGAMLDDLF